MEGGGTIIDPIAWYTDEPDKLRAIIPLGLTCITRRCEDDPTVKETSLPRGICLIAPLCWRGAVGARERIRFKRIGCALDTCNSGYSFRIIR